MAGRKESVALLDTHILVWLYAGLTEKLTKKAKGAIEAYDLAVSHFSRLELQYLFEIKRITAKPATILKSHEKLINLKIHDCDLGKIIDASLKIGWTRDVFDRLIVAEATAFGYRLITADKHIKKHFKQSIW